MTPRPYWALRVGAAACFVGHGAFGFITKAAWVPYFAVLGIPERWAYALMPIVGAVDVLAAMAVLFAPTRLPLLYMTLWATWTAMLRPLAGESAFEMVERAGNYGVPLALLLWIGLPRAWRDLVTPTTDAPPEPHVRVTMQRVLQWTTVLLLVGHGALGVIGKPMLAGHYVAAGLSPEITPLVGWFELALAVTVALRPTVALLVVIVLWKLATESLFLVAGAPIWEVIERGGSYAAPAALALLLAGGTAVAPWWRSGTGQRARAEGR